MTIDFTAAPRDKTTQKGSDVETVDGNMGRKDDKTMCPCYFPVPAVLLTAATGRNRKSRRMKTE